MKTYGNCQLRVTWFGHTHSLMAEGLEVRNDDAGEASGLYGGLGSVQVFFSSGE